MQLGSWECIKIYHFGLFYRNYDQEILTKLLLLASLAIPTLLKNCPFLSLKPEAWFAFLLEFIFVYNEKWNRELLAHLCPVLWRCKIFFGSCLVQLPIFSLGKLKQHLLSTALSGAFKEISLPLCPQKASGCLYCQLWLKSLIQEPNLWGVLNMFGGFLQLMYFNI